MMACMHLGLGLGAGWLHCRPKVGLKKWRDPQHRSDVLPNNYPSPLKSQADFVCQVGEVPHWLEVHVGLR